MKFEDLNIMQVGHSIQIAGAIYADTDTMYLCLLPKEGPRKALETLEMTPENWERFLRQTDTMEVEIMAQSPDGKLAKALIRKSERQISQVTSWKVYRRDGFKCRYCAASDVPLTVDHLVLWEEGGPSIEANLVSCCKKCNGTRGSTHYDEWLKSPYYLDRSKRLDVVTRATNAALAVTLDKIPRQRMKSR